MLEISTQITDSLAGIEDPLSLFAGLFEHAPFGFMVYRADGTPVLANRAHRELFGAAPPPGYNVFRDEVIERQGFGEHLRRAFEGESVRVPAHWFVPREGQVGSPRRVAIEVSSFALRDPSGAVRHVAFCFKDVTERITAEDLRARTAHLERQNERILEASRYKSELLANMSHELRTPLNAIIGFGELLFDGHVEPSAPEHREFLGDILASGRHLLQLINDVLDLAKIESGKLDFFPEPVSTARIVAEACSILRPIAAEKRTRVDIQVDETLTDVEIDPTRFKQILYNYLSNAFKFTAHEGRITIRVLPEGDTFFRVEVQDDGVGIAPDDVARLFLELEQIEGGALRKQSGTGLGLALTRRLVEAQGGRVGVDSSAAGQGSVFYAILPRRGVPVSVTAPPLVQSGLTGRGPRSTGTNEP